VRPKTFASHEHGIDITKIDPDAIYVISTLQAAGYIAYLVGGSVRDLLVGRAPKDFDISTSARPEEIKRLFGKRCLLIGRRFRLAHVRFQNKVLEVSTFRAGDPEHAELIVRDNQFGTPEEDVQRRDFTINGLFYEPTSQTVIDYVGGVSDVHAKVLCTIGEPAKRFQQDPVRMLRLLKFMARLEFVANDATLKALASCKKEILKSSPTRILEEIFRMLESGYAEPFFRLMTDLGMLEILFPCLSPFIKGKFGADVYRLLAAADERQKKQEKPFARPLLFSLLLYPIVDRELQRQFFGRNLTPKMGDIVGLINSIVRGVITSSSSHFPRRVSASMEYILAMQYRLTLVKYHRLHRPRFLQHLEFPWSLELLSIRAEIQPHFQSICQHWKQVYQKAAPTFSRLESVHRKSEDEEEEERLFSD
jgi:poly(A) polymerase